MKRSEVVFALIAIGLVFVLDYFYDFPGWTQLDPYGLWFCPGDSAWWGQVCL